MFLLATSSRAMWFLYIIKNLMKYANVVFFDNYTTL